MENPDEEPLLRGAGMPRGKVMSSWSEQSDHHRRRGLTIGLFTSLNFLIQFFSAVAKARKALSITSQRSIQNSSSLRMQRSVSPWVSKAA